MSILDKPGIASVGELAGSIALTAGVGTVNNALITTSSVALVTQKTPVGTLGVQYQAVCTAGVLTITAITAAIATQALDTSTVQYLIVF